MNKSTTGRILLVVLAGVLATFTLARTYSIVFATRNPPAALAAWSGNGMARASVADAVFRRFYAEEMDVEGAQGTPVDPPLADARRALADQALNPSAMRILALSSRLDEQQMLDMLEPVGELTRRDTLTQLFLVQNAALSEDLPGAMRHFDALLRRETAARDVTGRMLAQGMRNQDMADEVVRLLRFDPGWKSLLYYYLAQEPDNWPSFTQLHRELAGTDLIPLETSVAFAERMTQAGAFAEAGEIAQLVGFEPLTSASALVDTQFSVSPQFPGAWSVRDQSSGSLQPLTEGGALFDLGRGASGVLARRLVALEPGAYRALIEYEPLQGNDGSVELEARLTCADGDADLAGGRELSVDSQCPYQWLSIYTDRAVDLDEQIVIASVEVARNG